METIEYSGLTVNKLVQELSKAGVNKWETSEMVAGWIWENLGRTPRVFNYNEPFPASIAACLPAAFARTFVHVNWVDGEDLVQAADANGKEGFNTRFHKIETDLDRLGGDLGQVARCVADMRASMRRLLDEIRTEINVLHRKQHECCGGGNGFTAVTPGFSNGLLQTGKYLGTATMFGKEMMMYQTQQGTFTVPVAPRAITSPNNPKYQGAGKMLELFEKDAEVRAVLEQPNISIKDFEEKFGDRVLGDNIRVRDVVDILPENATYANFDALVDDLAERNATFIRVNNLADAELTESFGIDATVTNKAPGTLEVKDFAEVSPEARTALENAGIKTVEDLASTNVEKLNEIVKGVGESSTGTKFNAGAVLGRAKTLKQLGKRGRLGGG